jgi:hypothetical protein
LVPTTFADEPIGYTNTLRLPGRLWHFGNIGIRNLGEYDKP